MGIFSRKPKEPSPAVLDVAAGARAPDTHIPRQVSGRRNRTLNLLYELRRTWDVYDAIDLITSKHPDAAMARQSFVRLANNGHQMEIWGTGGARNEQAEALWREFASQAATTNTKGLDGLVDQCHESQLLFGGYGAELTVSKRLKSVDGVYPILPQWLTWEMDNSGVWHAFQQQGNKRVDLNNTNFFWVALDNKVGSPEGRLMMESSLMAIDRQLEFFEDSHQVLRRAGYPRNDIAIDREAVMAGAPASVKANKEALEKYMRANFDQTVAMMNSLEPTSDIIHFDDVKVNNQSGVNTRSVDLRSYNEVIDPQVINGLGTLALLLNRPTGVTETWGTVQFKILVHSLQNVQRGSKRLFEQICNFWLRVNGLEGTAKFVHNPVDWESELQKTEVLLKKQELHRKAEEYQWEDKAVAAKEAMDISELPTDEPNGLYQYIGKSLAPPGAGDGKEDSTQNNEGDPVD